MIPGTDDLIDLYDLYDLYYLYDLYELHRDLYDMSEGCLEVTDRILLLVSFNARYSKAGTYLSIVEPALLAPHHKIAVRHVGLHSVSDLSGQRHHAPNSTEHDCTGWTFDVPAWVVVVALNDGDY